jgi:hypothetical protein
MEEKMKKYNKNFAYTFILILCISQAVALYTNTDDLSGDGKIDSWYVDLNDNLNYDRWIYDTTADGTAEYYQYDLGANCYPEYTNRIYPDSSIGTQVNHFYADLNEDGLYDRKAYDSNGDGFADVYTYDYNFDGIYEEIKVDSDFSYINPNPNNESFDEWYHDTTGDGIYDLCMYDMNGDNNFSYADDFWINDPLGCYNYTFTIPVTSNIVYNLNNWPCNYTLPSSSMLSTSVKSQLFISQYNMIAGELEPMQPGDSSLITVTFENKGDIDFGDTSVRVSVPELGLILPKQWVRSFNSGDKNNVKFNLVIPEDAQPGEYSVKLHINSALKHRTVYRFIKII